VTAAASSPAPPRRTSGATPFRPARLLAWVIVAALLMVGATPSGATDRMIGPADDLCAEINSLSPGEDLVLKPGEYAGPCKIRRSGTPDTPIVIRAEDLGQRPRIVYNGTTANVFEIRGSHIVIRSLEFGPTQGDVDAIRIFSGGDITVEDCYFSRLTGIAVVANHTSIRGLTVRRNVILDSRATAMYFGCQDGTACTVTDLRVEDNFIRKVRAPSGAIGYGMEAKLNSVGTFRGNVIVDTKGPGIMVYGAWDLTAVSLVERNITVNSDRSSGIVVAGGPAIVRNNVSIGNDEAGIALEDYQKRGLLRGIVVAHNTVYDNSKGGIMTPAEGVHDSVIINNAAQAPVGKPPLPPAQTGIRMAGNVNCSRFACFANPLEMNFSPFPGSMLTGVGTLTFDQWIPRDDLFGRRRGTPPTVGAIERAAGALQLDPPGR
jgi:hypothetical protein